jgi:hypothetical protein
MLKSLQPFQLAWIFGNLKKDAEELEKVTNEFGKETKKFELDDDSFRQLISQFKK